MEVVSSSHTNTDRGLQEGGITCRLGLLSSLSLSLSLSLFSEPFPYQRTET